MNPMLIEVTNIQSGAALPESLDRVVHVLRVRLKYRKGEDLPFFRSASRLHAKTPA